MEMERKNVCLWLYIINIAYSFFFWMRKELIVSTFKLLSTFYTEIIQLICLPAIWNRLLQLFDTM